MAASTVTLGGLNAAATITTDAATNAGTVSVYITGTFSATITFEASTDGINWPNSVFALPVAGGQATSTAAAAGQFLIPVLGYNAVRARISSFTSGSASVALDFAAGTLNVPMTPSGGGMVDSVNAGGVTTAPLAGVAVVAAVTPGAGTWEISISTGLGGAASLAADIGNMQLQKNAGVLMKLAVVGSGGAVNPTVRATLLAADTISINAVGAATAGVAYTAALVAKRVS